MPPNYDNYYDTIYNYTIQILSTLQVIPHLVCHKRTKWYSDNHTLFSTPTNAKESILLFSHSWEENRWSMPFPRALARSETETASSRIWSWVIDYASFDGNAYARCASKSVYISVTLYVCAYMQYYIYMQPTTYAKLRVCVCIHCALMYTTTSVCASIHSCMHSKL